MESNPELLQYIKQSLAAGFNREAIKKNLISAGWQEADVDRALIAVSGNSVVPSGVSGSSAPVVSISSDRAKPKRFGLVLVGILILLVLAGAVSWWLWFGGSAVFHFGSVPNSDSSIVKADSVDGTIYGPLDKFIDKSVNDFKKRSPDATTEEVVDLTDKATKSYNDFRSQIAAALKKCAGFPAVATTSVSLNVDVLSKLGEEDPIFDQLKDSPLFPDVFAPGYAVYPLEKNSFDGCFYKDGGGGTTWNLLSSEDEYLAYFRAGDLAASRRVSCEDLPTTTEKDGMAFDKEEVWSVVSGGGGTVYAGVRDGGRCLYKSNNGGASWNRVAVNVENMIPQNLDFKNLLVDPSNSAHLYANGGMFYPAEGSGNLDYQTVIESRDGGVNWSPIIIDSFQTTGVALGSSGKLVYAMAMNPIWKKAGSGYNGVRTDYFLYRSEDGGKSWAKITNCENGSILAVNSTDEKIVYGVCGGVYRVSFDGGANWKNLLPDAKFKADKFLVSGDAVYAMSSDFTYRSYDAGRTFEKIKTQAGLMFFEVAISSANPKMLFMLNPQASSYNSDIYRSDDGGKIWKKFGPDLKLGLYDTIIKISVDDASKTLFVGLGKGLVRIPL